ncbi:MAG: zinc ABC transporter substrate-binding protein, partial [Pseudomonadota bacterium]
QFLKENEFEGKKLIDYLGGWAKQALPLRGKKIVTYHKNWTYFVNVFGLEIVEYVEPKPGIPPSPKHVADVIQKMKENNIKVLLAANYYDSAKVKSIAERVEACPVIVALGPGGEPGMKNFFSQFDIWIGRLLEAFSQCR